MGSGGPRIEGSWAEIGAGEGTFEWATSVFGIWAAVYTLLYLVSSLRVRGLFSRKGRKKRHLLGDAGVLSRGRNLSSYLAYSSFWGVVLAAKIAFDFYFTIELVGATRALWEDPSTGNIGMGCWDEDRRDGTCALDYPQWVPLEPSAATVAAAEAALSNATIAAELRRRMPSIYEPAPTAEDQAYVDFIRLFRAYFFRLLLVGARWAAPAFMIFSDTAFFYTAAACVASAVLGLVRGQSRVTTWGQLIITFPDTVSRFNSRLLAEAESTQGDARAQFGMSAIREGPTAAAPAAAPLKPKDRRWHWTKKRKEKEAAHEAEHARALAGMSYSVEGQSANWQRFARAWNVLVQSLHERDLLSRQERSTLRFSHLHSESALSFFGVAEYTIMPTMLLSPVFAPVLWQASSRARYPLFSRAMLQARDLSCWLIVTLGLAPFDRRLELLSCISQLASVEALQRGNREEAAAQALPKIRNLGADLIKIIAQLHAHGASGAGGEALAKLGEDAAKAATKLLTAVGELFGLSEAFESSRHGSGGATGIAAAVGAAPAMVPPSARISTRSEKATGQSEQARSYAEAPFITLIDLINLQPLTDAKRLQSMVGQLRQESVRVVTASLFGAFTTLNPGGEPKNAEARRQLLFFANSLHSTRLEPPPPVRAMKTLTSFTPHYAEDVTLSLAKLSEVGAESASSSPPSRASIPTSGRICANASSSEAPRRPKAPRTPAPSRLAAAAAARRRGQSRTWAA